MAEFPRPRVVFSSCLTGERVRYDGGSAENEFTLKLLKFSEPVRVCPEVSIGLTVPRDRIIVYSDGESYRVFQPSTGLDLTSRLVGFSEEFLSSLPQIDGFLLKAKSPSCGLSRTRTYRDREGRVFKGLGKGLFALKVLESFPDLPAEDEIRLRERRRRLHFLFRVFGLARIREGDLDEFHELISMTARVLSPRLESRMRRERDRRTYRELFLKVFADPPPEGVLEDLCGLLVPEELLYSPYRLP
ncbi:MAG: DUF523 domain-containing protein [Aquificota bacterium]|nr:DUF523 domain-containing protein [Aquificota bacterium]